jgi:hypothetical protein
VRVTETIETAAGAVTVRELTVGEIRQWLATLAARAEEAGIDVVGELLIDGFALSDLSLFAGGEVDADALSQSELRAIFDVAKRLNANFFLLRERLIRAGTQAILDPAPAAPSTPSSASPSP